MKKRSKKRSTKPSASADVAPSVATEPAPAAPSTDATEPPPRLEPEAPFDPECTSCGHPESAHTEEHFENLCSGFIDDGPRYVGGWAQEQVEQIEEQWAERLDAVEEIRQGLDEASAVLTDYQLQRQRYTQLRELLDEAVRNPIRKPLWALAALTLLDGGHVLREDEVDRLEAARLFRRAPRERADAPLELIPLDPPHGWEHRPDLAAAVAVLQGEQPKLDQLFPHLDVEGVHQEGERQRGVGVLCSHCSSPNTRVETTRKAKSSRHPHFLRRRRRYHLCADCGKRTRTG